MISDNSLQKNKPEDKYLLEIENLYKNNKIKKLEEKTRDLIILQCLGKNILLSF